jgi:hypothetical protein
MLKLRRINGGGHYQASGEQMARHAHIAAHAGCTRLRRSMPQKGVTNISL